MLKVLERLVERYLEDAIQISDPLHGLKFAYQPSKSVDTALHKLVSKLEGVKDRRELRVGIFMDRGGAFNKTPMDAIDRTSSRLGINPTWRRWTRNMLSDRHISVKRRGEMLEAIFRVAKEKDARRGEYYLHCYGVWLWTISW